MCMKNTNEAPEKLNPAFSEPEAGVRSDNGTDWKGLAWLTLLVAAGLTVFEKLKHIFFPQLTSLQNQSGDNLRRDNRGRSRRILFEPETRYGSFVARPGGEKARLGAQCLPYRNRQHSRQYFRQRCGWPLPVHEQGLCHSTWDEVTRRIIGKDSLRFIFKGARRRLPCGRSAW